MIAKTPKNIHLVNPQLILAEFWPHRVQAGDAVPDVTLYEGTPGDKVNLKDLFFSKKGVIFGVPGAFTPGCDKV